jgi:hypothetical protein
MKYLLFIPLLVLVLISFLIGGIAYLWRFSASDFRKGAGVIETKTGFITALMNFLDKK